MKRKGTGGFYGVSKDNRLGHGAEGNEQWKRNAHRVEGRFYPHGILPSGTVVGFHRLLIGIVLVNCSCSRGSGATPQLETIGERMGGLGRLVLNR